MIGLNLNILKKNNKIVIITNSNKNIGNGHFVRSKNLCYILKNNNYKTQLLHNIKDKEIENKIFKQRNIFLIIIDTNQIKIQLINKLINNFKVLCLDNFQNIKPHYNILIHEHKKIKIINQKFVGLKYINLRNEITKINKKKSKELIYKKNVLICIGSGDIKNQG